MDDIDLTQLPDSEKENLLAEIEKGQQLAGHFPDATAMNRARRVLAGEITIDEAIAEVDALYR